MKSISELYHRSFAIRILVGFLAAAALLTILGLFTTNSHLFIPHFDDVIGTRVRSYASPRLTSIFLFVTRLGSTVGLTTIGVVVIGVFLYMRRLKYIGLLLLVMLGQGILQLSFKAIFERPRPQAMFDYVIGDTPSFPSGHALASICFFGLLAYLISINLRSTAAQIGTWFAAVTIVLLVGLTRIYFDVHYPSDVIAGYAAGLVWMSTVASGAK